LGCRTKTRRTRADNGNFFLRAEWRRFGYDPAFIPGFVNDGALDIFYSYRRSIDAKNAGAFAGCRANATGAFGKIICLMKPFECLLPQASVNQIVPFRDKVVNGTTRSHAIEQSTGMTEWNAAIHATGRLLAEPGFGHVIMELIPILNAFEG